MTQQHREPSAKLLHRKEKYNTMTATITTGALTEVPVTAGVLQATARLLAQLAEFFDMHPQARVALGHFLAARDQHAGDAAAEGAVTVCELTDAAELLDLLASIEREG